MNKFLKHVSIAATLTALSLATAGCNGIPIRVVEDEKPAPVRTEADDAIEMTVLSIKTGQLVEARQHLAIARETATTDRQRQRIRSLEKLLDGADAMMVGDGAGASLHWSQIEDPDLRQQVQSRAGQLHVATPAATVANQR